MSNWFECKVKFDTIEERSKKDITVTEIHILDALSFTEAETRIHEEMEAVIRGNFDVGKISKAKIEDIFSYDGSGIWYRCKVILINIDEKSGKEKKVSLIYLCSADTVKEACIRIEEQMKDTLVPWSVFSIQETQIKDIFPYVKPEEVKEED